MHLTTLSSWATLMMCCALALLVIWACHYRPRHRATDIPDWDAYWASHDDEEDLAEYQARLRPMDRCSDCTTVSEHIDVHGSAT